MMHTGLKLLTLLLGVSSSAQAVSVQNPISLSDASTFTPLSAAQEICEQSPAVFPARHKDLDHSLEELYNSKAFQLQAIETLSAIVQVPSESYDNLGPVGQDPRWDSFKDLHAQLETIFPLVYSTLNVTKVNTYGLVFHWQGTDPSLKPILMTAHQDVVPVEQSTLNQWIHPPYSGYYDGKWIWGRGSCDDKPDLISQLTTIDSLLKQSFEPTRTFVFAFGFDEESSGRYGASQIGQYLEATYGRDSFAALLDEGFGFQEATGGDLLFAVPCTGEKGYLDVSLVINTPGGHSSVPPRHTAIGILAAAIVEIEAHPHPTSLQRTGTAFQQIQCLAKYSPDVPDKVRKLAEHAMEDDDALEELANTFIANDPLYTAVLGTTQAVDLVTGGVKVNALPEKVEAVINHRIAEDSSVKELEERFTNILLPVARKYNISLNAFGKQLYAGSEVAGEIVLTEAWGHHLEPAPMTPTVGSKPWELLSGTIKAALKSSPQYSGRDLVVVPNLALGNTDTKYYWNLTRHIYRYSHSNKSGMYNGAHTVNEALDGNSLIDKMRFHTKWILNWDESDL